MRSWEDVVGKGAKKYRGMCREVGEGREPTEGSMGRERLREVSVGKEKTNRREHIGRLRKGVNL